MNMHAIVEIEEGSLNVIVGDRDGVRTRVVHSVRIPLADLATQSVENALRAVGSDVLQSAAGVHVVIGDRRAQHFLSMVPRMSARDAQEFVVREAVRLATLQSADEVMVATRLVRQLPGNKMVLGSSALARAVWEPVMQAFANSNLQVLSLQTMETCLALATDAWHAEPVAVLECNGSRARYVVCVDQVAVKVRRFLISGGGDSNEATLMTQLAMELPRTLDWLRESGQKLPRRLLIGSRVALADESLQMLASEEVGQLKRANLEVECEDNQAVPSMGVGSLLNRLASGGKVTSLLDGPNLRLPMGKRHWISLVTAACVAVIGGYGAIVDGSRWMQARRASNDLGARSEQVRVQIEDTAMAMAMASSLQVEGEPQLLRALAMRRPISRLISEVSNNAGDDVCLEELRFASKSPIVISGHVQGSSRQQALAAMGRFTTKVRAMPFVLANGQDEMSEVAGHAHRFRFKINLAWRNQ